MIRIKNYLQINGKKQYIEIRSNGDNLPILVYLHGGPGDAALPLVKKYNKKLEDYYTVVIWEQRGAGKSYYPFSEDEDICRDVFLKDLHTIIQLLLKQFKQEKVYLVGHSWGSVLGLQYIQIHPETVYKYIGCGQVVNMKKGSHLAYQFAVQKNKETGNKKALAKLMAIDDTYKSDNWLNELLFVTKEVVKYKGSFYGKSNYNSMIRDVVFSKDYSLKELVNRQKGSLQSIKRLWPELMDVNFETITEFQVPIVFIEGRSDYHVSSILAEEYYRTITSEKEWYWFEKSAHFPQWCEPDKFTAIMSAIV